MSLNSHLNEKLLVLSAHGYSAKTGGLNVKKLRKLTLSGSLVKRREMEQNLLKSYPASSGLNTFYSNICALTEETIDISGKAMKALFSGGLNSKAYYIHVNIIHSLLLNTTVDTIKLNKEFRKVQATTKKQIIKIMRSLYDDEGVLFDNETVLEKVDKVYTLPLHLSKRQVAEAELKKEIIMEEVELPPPVHPVHPVQAPLKRMRDLGNDAFAPIKQHKRSKLDNLETLQEVKSVDVKKVEKKLLKLVKTLQVSVEEQELKECYKQKRQQKHQEMLTVHKVLKQQKQDDMAELKTLLQNLGKSKTTPEGLELVKCYKQKRKESHLKLLKINEEVKQQRRAGVAELKASLKQLIKA